MTKLLEKAFAQASLLSEEEQDVLARRLLLEIAEEQAWDKTFSSSADSLARLAGEALAEDRAGRTEELDPDRL